MAFEDTTIMGKTKADAEKAAVSEKKEKNKDLKKTKLCAYFLNGDCGYGSDCLFAHNVMELKNVPDLKKTQLCAKFAEGKCFNKNCTFAHGEAELKDRPNHKKKLCKWFSKGTCRNGASCGFAHDIKELREDAAPAFETVSPKAPGPLNAKKLELVSPPPGLAEPYGVNDFDAATDVPSTEWEYQAESDLSNLSNLSATSIPEEHFFRFVAGRGSAPLQHQVALMSSAIGGLQAKLSQLEDMMLQKQVQQMQQHIEQLSEQCWALESGLGSVPPPSPLSMQQPHTSLSRSRLNAKAMPFMPFQPVGTVDGTSDDSTSVGSD